jgi:hypothetical protein
VFNNFVIIQQINSKPDDSLGSTLELDADCVSSGGKFRLKADIANVYSKSEINTIHIAITNTLIIKQTKQRLI